MLGRCAWAWLSFEREGPTDISRTMSRSAPLGGGKQTINRAEMWALIVACRPSQEDKRVWEGAAKIYLHFERDVLQKVMFGVAAKILATGG